MEKLTREALKELGVEANIMKIMEYGVMHTPVLIIDGKVVVSGRVPNEKNLKNLIIQ